MAGGLQGSGALAVLGVAAAAVVATVFGVLKWDENRTTPTPPPTSAPVQSGPVPPASPPASGQAALTPPARTAPESPAPPTPPPAPQATPAPQSPPAFPPAPHTPPAAPAASAAPPPAPQPPSDAARSAPPAQPQEAAGPSFDVVRVEPTGDSVIAGRGVPGATVELLRDGQVHARGVADQSGLFALVPPPLPPGSHQITLQAIAPDGTRQRSPQSVTVAIAAGRNTPPLVALTAPDKPTVVLSNPEPPEQRAAQPASPAQQPAAPAGGQQQASLPPAPQAPAARPGVKIVSVEAEEGGRLFVSGEAAPGATVRLYLNETLIAPGGVGSDGKVSFAIGRGVRPGDYRVRIDDVDPVSGAVKSRAEVAFNVPAPLAVPLPPQASAVTTPPQIAGVSPAIATPPATSMAPPSAQALRPAPSAQDQASGSAPASPPVGQAGPPRNQTAAPAPGPQPDTPAAPGASPTRPREVASAEPGRSPAGQSAGAANPAQDGGRPAAPDDRMFPPGTIVIPDINTTIVSRGDNLWRISQRVYGRGTRYTVIYGANQPQIRNPNLIYPGQVFVLPGQEPTQQ